MEKENLQKLCDELGLKYYKNTTIAKLQKMIDEYYSKSLEKIEEKDVIIEKQENHLEVQKQLEIVNAKIVKEQLIGNKEICKILNINDNQRIFVIKKYKNKFFTKTQWVTLLNNDKVTTC